MMVEVSLYTKPDCPLCEKALRVIRQVQLDMPFDLVIRDITKDEALFNKYCFEIPVITLGGIVLFRGRVLEKELRAAIKERVRRPNR